MRQQHQHNYTTRCQNGEEKSSKKSTDHLAIGPMYPMAQFVVNLLNESGNRFLKVSIDLELSDPKLQPEMDHKKVFDS